MKTRQDLQILASHDAFTELCKNDKLAIIQYMAHGTFTYNETDYHYESLFGLGEIKGGFGSTSCKVMYALLTYHSDCLNTTAELILAKLYYDKHSNYEPIDMIVLQDGLYSTRNSNDKFYVSLEESNKSWDRYRNRITAIKKEDMIVKHGTYLHYKLGNRIINESKVKSLLPQDFKVERTSYTSCYYDEDYNRHDVRKVAYNVSYTYRKESRSITIHA